MSSDTQPGDHRYRLDDEQWLRAQYAVNGDKAIARYVGVSDITVRRARAKFGIVSRPRGAERGTTRRMSIRQPAQPVEMQLAGRIAVERSNGVPPTEELVAARTAGYISAKNAHDLHGMIDQALSAATAWALVAEQLTARSNG